MGRARRTATVTSVATLFAVASAVGTAGPAGAATFGGSWQFNEKSGSAVDSTGNGNTGTLHGGIVRTGTQYHFDGYSGYVSVPDSSTLDPGSGNIAITVRFTLDGNPSPSGYDYDLARKGLGSTSGGDYKAEVLDNGKGFCHFRGDQHTADLTGGSGLGSGTHTLKCVKTSSSVSLLVDGSVKASKTVTVGSIANSSGVALGAKPADDYTHGYIDYVTISTS